MTIETTLSFIRKPWKFSNSMFYAIQFKEIIERLQETKKERDRDENIIVNMIA